MGYKPYLVKGDDPKKMHKLMAETLDEIISYINSDGLLTINLESNTPATDAYFNTLVPEITINYTNTDEPIIT